MSDIVDEAQVAKLFDAFCEEFATFDGKRVAALFIAPGIALKADGDLKGFRTQEEIEAYYQSALDFYKSSGCTECRWSNLDMHRINATSVVGTVDWQLVTQDGQVLREWRQAYFVSRFGDGLRIYGSAFAS